MPSGTDRRAQVPAVLDFLRTEYGNLASVLGLLLTVGGFLFTWSKQKQLRLATEAAQRQALQIVQAFTERLARDDISGAATLAQDLKHQVRAEKWEQANDRAERLRRQLARLVLSKKLEETERAFLREAVDDARQILQAVEKVQTQPTVPFPTQARRKLDSLIMELETIDGRLKNVQLEIPNG